jgi:hypothetical protein
MKIATKTCHVKSSLSFWQPSRHAWETDLLFDKGSAQIRKDISVGQTISLTVS